MDVVFAALFAGGVFAPGVPGGFDEAGDDAGAWSWPALSLPFGKLSEPEGLAALVEGLL